MPLRKNHLDDSADEMPLLDILNPPSMFLNGIRQRDSSFDDICPFSGRLLPEFDKRRSIKDMFNGGGFGKKSTVHKVSVSADVSKKGSSAPVTSMAPPFPDAQKRKQSSEPPTAATSKKAKTRKTSLSRSDNSQQKLGLFFKSKSLTHQSRSLPVKSKTKELDKPATFKPQDAGINTNSSPKEEGPKTDSKGTNGSERPYKSTAGDDCSSLDIIPDADEHRSVQQRLDHEWEPAAQPSSLISQSLIASSAKSTPPLVDQDSQQGISACGDDDDLSVQDIEAAVEANFRSRSQWSKLFTPRAAPLCESHHEPCKKLETKKKGINCGRSFWICARYVSPCSAYWHMPFPNFRRKRLVFALLTIALLEQTRRP